MASCIVNLFCYRAHRRVRSVFVLAIVTCLAGLIGGPGSKAQAGPPAAMRHPNQDQAGAQTTSTENRPRRTSNNPTRLTTPNQRPTANSTTSGGLSSDGKNPGAAGVTSSPQVDSFEGEDDNGRTTMNRLNCVYGDVVGCANNVCNGSNPCDGVDDRDINYVLDAFAKSVAHPLLADLCPCVPNGVIDLDDIFAVLNVYGDPELTCSDACPGTNQFFDPEVIGFTPGLGYPLNVTLSRDGRVAYVASLEMGLVTVAVSDRSRPSVLANVPSHDLAHSDRILISDDPTFPFALALSQQGAARVVDIDDPLAPQVVHILPVAAFGGCIRGNVAYLPSGGMIRVFDLAPLRQTPPSAPVERPSISVFANDIVVSSDARWGYASTGLGIKVIDLQSRTVRTTLATMGHALGVALTTNGTTLVVADDGAGIRLVNVSAPTNPVYDGAPFAFPASPWRFQVTRDAQTLREYVVVALMNGSAAAIDLTNRVSLGTVSGFTISGASAAGNLLAFTDQYMGLRLYEIQPGASPLVARGNLQPPPTYGSRTAIAFANDIALVGTHTSGQTYVVNLADPTMPARVSQIPVSSTGIAMNGSTAYLCGGGSGLQTWDLENPAAPQLRSQLPMFANDILLRPDVGIGYASLPTQGIRVIDFSDPNLPSLGQLVDTPGTPNGLAFETGRSLLYVADGIAGLTIFDVSDDPGDPQLTANLPMGLYNARGVVFADGHVFLYSGDHPVKVVDVRNASSPILVNSVSSYVLDVATKNGRMYFVRGLQGVDVYDWSASGELSFIGNVRSLSNRVDAAIVAETSVGEALVTGNWATPVVVYDVFDVR